MRWIGSGLKQFYVKAYEDNLTGLAGMVAYSLLLSIFPVALIALFVAGQVLSAPDLERSVLADLQELFPSATSTTLSQALSEIRSSSTTVGIVAFVASLWVATSFWGALDTAFCRIYHCECRTWVRQKVFAIGMFAVMLLFVAVTVMVPAAQALLASGARDLPLGLSNVEGLVYWVTISIGVVALFVTLCVIYRVVPKAPIPWAAVWPGALGATLAIGIVDLGFPLYLDNISTLRIGTSAVFVLIALVWFYVIALILLAGAVVNALRFEHASRST
jgi:YihY family inner membrane protein